jgi:hypothetical protein
MPAALPIPSWAPKGPTLARLVGIAIGLPPSLPSPRLWSPPSWLTSDSMAPPFPQSSSPTFLPTHRPGTRIMPYQDCHSLYDCRRRKQKKQLPWKQWLQPPSSFSFLRVSTPAPLLLPAVPISGGRPDCAPLRSLVPAPNCAVLSLVLKGPTLAPLMVPAPTPGSALSSSLRGPHLRPSCFQRPPPAAPFSVPGTCHRLCPALIGGSVPRRGDAARSRAAMYGRRTASEASACRHGSLGHILQPRRLRGSAAFDRTAI